MPRPPILAYAEPELISSAIDNTSVHSNIDRLLLESEINVNYGKEYSYPEHKYGYVPWQETQPTVFNVDEPPPPQYYPWKQRIKTGETETAVPINMQDYATIMEAADISDVSYPFHPKESNLFPEISQKELIEKMKKGDVPGGMVAYSTGKGREDYPGTMGEYVHDKSKSPSLNLGLSKYYPPISDGSPEAPDTVFITPSADEHTLFHEPLHWLTGGHPDSADVSNRKMKAATREGFDIIESELLESAKKNMGEDLFNLYMSKIAAGEKVTPMDMILLGSDIQIGKQEGGPAERPPLLGYMNPADALEDSLAWSMLTKNLKYRMDEGDFSQEEYNELKNHYDMKYKPSNFFQVLGLPKKYRNPLEYEWSYDSDGELIRTPKNDIPDNLDGMQQGGPISLLQPAIQDETAHSQMDRLMFENELEQQPQYSMGIQQEVYDPAQAWGEGMMPIGGMLRGGKGALAMLKHSYGPYAKQSAHYRDILDKKLMNILKKYESQTRGRNIEKSLSTGAGQEATKEAMETDYIIQKLGGKYTIE